jgi:hypothetical protein
MGADMQTKDDDRTDAPVFGCDPWLKGKLLEALERVRHEVTRFYEAEDNENSPSIDFDAYSYIKLSKSYRKLWKFLSELAIEENWLQVGTEEGTIDIAPACSKPYNWHNPAADAIAVKIFNDDGVPATHFVRYR